MGQMRGVFVTAARPFQRGTPESNKPGVEPGAYNVKMLRVGYPHGHRADFPVCGTWTPQCLAHRIRSRFCRQTSPRDASAPLLEERGGLQVPSQGNRLQNLSKSGDFVLNLGQVFGETQWRTYKEFGALCKARVWLCTCGHPKVV